MPETTYHLILALLGAIIVGLLWIVDRRGRDLRDSIPPSVLPLLTAFVRSADEWARLTRTPVDDELVARIAARLGIDLRDEG